MRRLSRIWIPVAAAALIAACRADVEDPGSLPDVDVRGGELPEIDIDPAEVEISTDTQVVAVPDLDVDTSGR